ncbi:MAG: hypothetical protein KME30_27400 [Iphinoe sp. HA4291-MV1]|jgi:hypothetical protein|nr:hypothetical protein [Iphinoe sp. HA4291-MV1]
METDLNWRAVVPTRHLASEWEENFLTSLEAQQESGKQLTQKQIDKFYDVARRLEQRWQDRELCKRCSNFDEVVQQFYWHLTKGGDLTERERSLLAQKFHEHPPRNPMLDLIQNHINSG